MAGRSVSSAFVGRSQELELAGAVVERGAAGASTHLLVSGEAGVGKTRFTGEVERMAVGHDYTVLRGGCIAVGGVGLPYAPIAALLRDALRADGPAARDSMDPSMMAALSTLAPALSDEGVVRREGISKTLLFDALLRFLQRLAGVAPLLLVIEDLHWADPATREAIAFLIPNLISDRVTLCLTYRSDELDRRHPLLPWVAELGRSGRFERIDLRRFDRDETALFMARISGSEPSPATIDRIQRRADGNAFFIEELLMAGGGLAVGNLPSTVRATLTARVTAAPEPAQHVLRLAAVAGRRVEEDLLYRVARMDRDDLNAGLRAAVDAHLLVPDEDAEAGGYAFRHALVQEAVYDDLLPGERRSLHRAYAEQLEAMTAASGASGAAHWAELAHHWGGAHDDVQAAKASVRAGDAATATFAFMAAEVHYERALELWDSVPDPATTLAMDRVALLMTAAGAAESAGEFQRMVDLINEAIAIGGSADPIRGALLRERLGRALWAFGDTDGALESYSAAMTTLPTDEPTSERARVLAGMGQMLMLIDRDTEAIALCDEAVSIARAVGDRRTEGHALNTRGASLAWRGVCDEGLAALEAALAIALELDAVDDVGRAYTNITDAMRLCSQDSAALDRVDEGIATITRIGVTGLFGPVMRYHGALIAFSTGDWARAGEYEMEALRFPRPDVNTETYGLAYTIGLAVGRGDPGIEARLDRFHEIIEGRRAVEGQFAVQYTLARAEYELWRGRPAEALAAIAEGLRWLAPKEFHRLLCLVHAVGARAEADAADVARASRAGHDAVASSVARIDGHIAAIEGAIDGHALGPGASDELVSALRSAEAERTRALGASDPACWIVAVEAWENRGRPYGAAYARWREAEAHLEQGDRAAARDALAATVRWASEHGARPLLAETEALARRARIDVSDVRDPAQAGAPSADVEPPDRPEPASGFGLTKREREVLALVAEGWTNRQIADHLFISENTVGVHVGNILGKLGASGRTEAAAIAHRLGLVAKAAGATEA